MNQFNFSRFFKFFSNEWKMNAKQILLLWGGLMLSAGLYCVVASLGNMDYIEKYGVNLVGWFNLSVILLFCVGQGFYISIQLGAFTSKVKKTALLLQPVSKAEFLMAKLFSCFVLFPLLYIAFVALVAWLISRYNMVYVKGVFLYGNTLETYPYMHIMKRVAMTWWPCVTVIFWTGAFYFGRYSVVKSALTALSLYACLAGFGLVLFRLISGCWAFLSFPILSYTSKTFNAWNVFYAWPGFFEAFLLFGCIGMVVMSVFKYKEKTL